MKKRDKEKLAKAEAVIFAIIILYFLSKLGLGIWWNLGIIAVFVLIARLSYLKWENN